MFGLLVFVNFAGWGYSIIAGALSVSILNIPSMTRIAENAIKTASKGVKEASLGLGASKWQTIVKLTLPIAMGEILTGIILSAGRIFGEAAAFLYTAGLSSGKLNFNTISLTGKSAFSLFRPAETLAVHIWKLNSEAIVPDAAAIANGTAAVLIIAVLLFNILARVIGNRLLKASGGKSEAIMAIIETKNLDLYYGTNKALKNINMNINQNEVTALIGPSGCGKSTFLRTLNRMNVLIEGVKVTGEVLFEGKNIYDDYDEIALRKRVGMVFQKANPFPMSIYDNIAYGPKIHGIKDKKTLDEIVERSLRGAALWDETKDRLKKSALGLSGGQQQRLCIARTLAVSPEVILMDEPTSALDPISTSKVEELMDELKKKYTVIIVTHNMQQAGRIADKTAFFLNGEVIEFGKTEDIFYKPKDKRTEDYITGRFG